VYPFALCHTRGVKVGVVGAGISGLAATKVLRSVGHEVATFERVADVGGVWSASRRYPGLRTQNTRMTYGFSDHEPPDSWPERPDAEQWQSYLDSYVDRFGLAESLRLGDGVALATPTARSWEVVLDSGARVELDHLVVANGVFCQPKIPDWPGRESHAAGGGVVKAPSEQLTLEDARRKDVVVVGYGKSACDVALSLSQVASSVTVVARRLLWKGAKRALGRDGEDFVMTRAGEMMFARPTVFRPLFDLIGRAANRQQALAPLDLVPRGRFEEIAQSTISLATDGLSDAVRAGTIVVRRDRSIAALAGQPGPSALLDDGSVVAADLVVAATGFDQRVPFLHPSVRVQNDAGDFELYRRILPHDAPNLTFCGYNSSLISTTNAEVAAVWTAAYLAGAIVPPAIDRRRAEVSAELAEMAERTGGRHARGTCIIPFSIKNIDQMLDDLGTTLSLGTRAAQWVRRAKPSDYRATLAQVLESLDRA
jgi:cation diffusion facilitator CzcD-associated flavoprotein CzcO